MTTPKEAFKEYKQVALDLANGEYDNYSPYIKQGEALLELAPIIEQALTELESIKSADGSEALEELELIREYYEDETSNVEFTIDSWNIVRNYLLKARVQEIELEELKNSDASKEQSSIDYFNEFKRVERELKEFKKNAHILNFSVDNEFVHIKGYGVYRKCDLEPENGFIVKKVGEEVD